MRKSMYLMVTDENEYPCGVPVRCGEGAAIAAMKIFVYGTLKRGFSNYAAQQLHARGEYVGSAVIRAQLCRCGPYPGLLPGEGRVRGEVFRVTAHLLRYLDAYEGSAYRRVVAPVRLESGAVRRLFVYMMRAPE